MYSGTMPAGIDPFREQVRREVMRLIGQEPTVTPREAIQRLRQLIDAVAHLLDPDPSPTRAAAGPLLVQIAATCERAHRDLVAGLPVAAPAEGR